MNRRADRVNGHGSLLERRQEERGALRDRILLRAEWLEPADRALVESVYADHVPITRLAKVRGHTPRRVRRRIQRLASQLLAPSASYVLARRSDWGEERWQVARKHLVAGRDMRGTAADLGLTLHAVRKHIEAVRTLYEAERAHA